jgi:branched-chain amino acid aminotransferase
MSPLIKAGANYINSRMAHIEAQNNGYDSAIFLNKDGYVAEGTGACVFLVRNNRLLTPDTSSSILESITRDTILDLAKDMGLQVEERKISRTELYMADELFLCGSAAELTPVIEIDGYRVGAGVPGKLTMDLHSFYIEAVSGSLENHRDWITRLI